MAIGLARRTAPVDAARAFDDLFATTWAEVRKNIVDVTFRKLPFWFWLNTKGRMRGQAGGKHIESTLEIGKNSTVGSIRKGQKFTKTDEQMLEENLEVWKYLGGSVTRFATDDAENAGEYQRINLVDRKINNLIKSLKDELNTQLLGDGTGNAGADINGLRNLINPTGVGTVHGINATTYTWWRNQFKASSGAASVFLLTDLENQFNTAGGTDQDFPDFHMTTQTIYELYVEECQEQKQIVNQTMADAAFTHCVYKGAPVIWIPGITTGYWYMINSGQMEFVYNTKMNFKRTPWKEEPDSPDAMMQVLLGCNLCVLDRTKLSVQTGIAA